MSTNPGIVPLNWKALVNEALRRRKAERLTQREHAALADVSVPTIAAFDRGDATLTLAKAFDILRIVGLVDEPPQETPQDAFVRKAFMRWQALSAKLPADSPARFPYGGYRFDYYLEGNLKDVKLQDFEELLRKAKPNVFSVFRIRDISPPHEHDGALEDLSFNEEGANDSYFWRATPNGQMFWMRGYIEDSLEHVDVGSRLYTRPSIYRMGEVLVHAESLASLLQREAERPIIVHFRALYFGLSGRILSSADSSSFDAGRAARSDEALLEAHIPAKGISTHLAEHLYPMVAALYRKFGITELSHDFVREEAKRFLDSRKLLP